MAGDSEPLPEELRRFVNEERWTYAKTMPAWPHNTSFETEWMGGGSRLLSGTSGLMGTRDAFTARALPTTKKRD
jgi:hypothetical protein